MNDDMTYLIDDLQEMADKHGMTLEEVALVARDMCDYILECHDRGITVERYCRR